LNQKFTKKEMHARCTFSDGEEELAAAAGESAEARARAGLGFSPQAAPRAELITAAGDNYGGDAQLVRTSQQVPAPFLISLFLEERVVL
jgi:hypothetical protein